MVGSPNITLYPTRWLLLAKEILGKSLQILEHTQEGTKDFADFGDLVSFSRIFACLYFICIEVPHVVL